MAKRKITHLSAETDAAMLRDAAKLVERGWTTVYSARDKDGDAVNFHDRRAVCFCTVGAIQRAVLDGLGGGKATMYTQLYSETYSRLERDVYRTLHGISQDGIPSEPVLPHYIALGDWNDQSADQNAVVALLNKAATLALSETTEHERS